MADIPIQLRHTTNLTPALIGSADISSPSHLLIGEPALAIASPAGTKMWIGDTTSNRLLLSTVDTDDPIFTNRYLKLSGGQQLTGQITTTQTTFTGTQLVNADWVHAAIAEGQPYAGEWDVGLNDPDVLTVTKTSGAFWTVKAPGGIPTVTLPGIDAGTNFLPGDSLTWRDQPAPNGTFFRTSASGMTQPEGDARYLRLGYANTMTTGGSITMPTGYAPTGLQVATAAYVSGSYVPLAGGVTMTGNLNLGTTTTPVGGLNVYGAVVVHGSGGTFNFVSENFTGLEGDSTWSLWADGDGTASYAMLSAGNSAGPGQDQSRLLVRSNGTVEFGSSTFDNAFIECWGAIQSSGNHACFMYESENEAGVLAGQWYMWAQGTSGSADGTETHFAPETSKAPGPAGPALVIRADGRLVVQTGPRTTAAGASDVVRRQDVDTWVTKISGGTF